MSRILKGSATAAGLLIHDPKRYDFLVRMMAPGGEGRLRRAILALARLQPGERVLDIGCGTGTLAIMAKAAVGPEGVVEGIDPSPEMLDHARTKARKARAEVAFRQAEAQALPQADNSVDVVLSSFMLHHVAAATRTSMFAEMRRVLRPEGRLLVVDFLAGMAGAEGAPAHRHGTSDFGVVTRELLAQGFLLAGEGAVGAPNVHFALAGGPGLARVTAPSMGRSWPKAGHVALILLAVAAFVGLHLGVLAAVPGLASGWTWAGIGGSVAVVIIVKVGILGLGHRVFGRRLLARLHGHRPPDVHRH